MRTKPLLLALSLLMAACTGQDVAENPDAEEMANIDSTLAEFKSVDPDLQRFFDGAYGYAVFPSVGKGGLGIGAAKGTGYVYEQGKLVGEAVLTQLTVGAQAGGQAYAELIFFRDPTAFNKFKAGNTELGAEVTAVVLKERASKDAGYDPFGMAIFVLPKGGLMAEASIGGQKFSYEPFERPIQ